MTNSPEAIAAATEILEAAQRISYKGTKHFIETRASIIQKHYAAKDRQSQEVNRTVVSQHNEIVQLKARVAELEKALRAIADYDNHARSDLPPEKAVMSAIEISKQALSAMAKQK